MGTPSIDTEQNSLVIQWLPFARRMARKYGRWCRFTGDVRDLEQAASEGLCRARETYDPDRGSFSTHAAHVARAEIQRELARHGIRRTSIRVLVPMSREPVHEIVGELEARDQLRRVSSMLGAMPHRSRSVIIKSARGTTAASIAKELGVTRQAVSKQIAKIRTRLEVING